MIISSLLDFDGVLIHWWQFWLILAIVGVVCVALIVGIGKYQSQSSAGNCTMPYYSKLTFSTRDIVFGAIALAMSIVLNYLPLFTMPYGGSITFASALPMLIYGFFFGFRKSLVVCFAYMLLSMMRPYIVTPWSALLDYVIPSFAFCATGMIYRRHSNKKTFWLFAIGVLIYLAIRMFTHTLAGVLFWNQGIDFGAWQGDLSGWSAWSYSFVYNAIYLIPDTLIVLIVGFAFFKQQSLVKLFSNDKHNMIETNNTVEPDKE